MTFFLPVAGLRSFVYFIAHELTHTGPALCHAGLDPVSLERVTTIALHKQIPDQVRDDVKEARSESPNILSLATGLN